MPCQSISMGVSSFWRNSGSAGNDGYEKDGPALHMSHEADGFAGYA